MTSAIHHLSIRRKSNLSQHPWLVAIEVEDGRREVVYGAKTQKEAECVREGIQIGLRFAGIEAVMDKQ